MATMRERTSKATGKITWQVLWKVGRRQDCLTFHDKGAAYRFLGALEQYGPDVAKRELRDSALMQSTSPRLSEWFEQHITDLVDATEGTRATYRSIVRRYWLAELGDPRLVELTRSSIAAAVNRLAARPLSPKTVRNAHGLLSSALEGAVRDGVLPANPARSIRLPKPAPPRHVVISEDEMADILQNTPPHYRPLLIVMGATGLRWGEATALAFEHIDLRNLQIKVEQAWKLGRGSQRVLGVPKSRAGHRTVTISPALAEILRPVIAGKKRGDQVFLTPSGTQVKHANFYARVWKKACQAAGFDPVPGLHSLRHSHATALVARGVHLDIVRARIGHESIGTTSAVYSHVSPEIQRAAVDAASVGLPQITSG